MNHIEEKVSPMIGVLLRAMIESLQADRDQIRRDLLAMREERDTLRAQIDMEKSKQLKQRTADPEPTVIEGWTIRVDGTHCGWVSTDHVERCCQLRDDGSFAWRPRALAEVPERARLEVEYQLLAARARFVGWAWGAFPYGHGLWFARVKELWMYDGKGNPGIGDTPPAYIRALAERAERRIAG